MIVCFQDRNAIFGGYPQIVARHNNKIRNKIIANTA